MSEEINPNDVVEQLGELRKDYEEVRKHALLGEEKERILGLLEKQEDANQKAVLLAKRTDNLETEIAEQKEKIDELTTKAVSADHLAEELKNLEALIAQRPGNEGEAKDAWKDSEEYKALASWAEKSYIQLAEEQKATLRTDVDTAAGFLAPAEMDSMLMKEIVELDPIRSLARVKTIASKAVEMAVRTDIPRATFEGEAEENQEDIGAYRLVTATPYRQSISIPITLDMIMNGNWDMESELVEDAALGFAEGEGQGFISGSGHKEPEGITGNADVVAAMSAAGATNLSAVTTATPADFADAIIAITGELKVGYNASYVMHRRTLAAIRQLRDTNGQFLWQPGLNGPVSNSINGFSYALSPTMDPWDTSSGNFLLFGDFGRGYTIVDRTNLSIVRDEVTRARKAIIVFTLHRWTTGIVTVPEAIRMARRVA